MKIKNTKRSICVPLTALLAGFLPGFFCVADAQAQETLERFKAPLPVVEEIDKAAFEEGTVLYEEIPGGDELLSYSVRLPKSWKKVTDGSLSNYSVSNRLLGEVARYYGPPDVQAQARSRFSIQVMEIEYQMSAQQWLLQHVLSNGYTIQGMKVHSERKVEAVLVILEKDISYVMRVVAQINGKRMIMAQHVITDAKWPAEQGVQAAVINSFALKNKKVETIEKMLLYHFLDVAEFKYPKSWEMRAPALRSVDRMSIKLSNLGQGRILNGQIELNLVSSFIAESLPDEIERLKKKQEKKGLLWGNKIEKKEGYNFNKYMEFAFVDVYAVTDADNKMLNYEVWIAMMSSNGYYYFLSLLTPGRDSDFFVWSRNTETYRLVLESIAPQDGALIED